MTAPKDANVSWQSYPLPMTRAPGPDQTIATHTMGDMIFRADGMLFLGDRAFLENQAIANHSFPGGIANREAGFHRTLYVTSTSDQREYRFSYDKTMWVRWVQAVNAPEETIGAFWEREVAHHGFIGAIFMLIVYAHLLAGGICGQIVIWMYALPVYVVGYALYLATLLIKKIIGWFASSHAP
jgi:hypothetical protein